VRRGLTGFAFVLALVIPGRLCLADEAISIDARQCESQFKALLLIEIDCTISLRASPAALPFAPEELRALLSQMECEIPLKFQKSQIYGQWITLDGAKFPTIDINCRLGVRADSTRLSGSAKLECSRPGGAWSCAPTLSNVTGIGVLGRALENYVNNNPGLWSTLSRTLTDGTR
jgi:hypothetical protein